MKKIFMFFLSLSLFTFDAHAQRDPRGTGVLTPADGKRVIGDVEPIGDPTPAGGRNIVWLHGLEGSANSWHHYDEKTVAERQVGKTFRPAYAGFGKYDSMTRIMPYGRPMHAIRRSFSIFS